MEIHDQQESWSEPETNTVEGRVPYSGPLSGPLVTNKKHTNKRSARFNDEYVEITLNVRDDSVSVQNIRGGDSETAFLATKLERRTSNSSLSSQLSFRLKQVSQELKRMASSTSRRYDKFDKMDRTKSGAARALKGLKFMTNNVASEEWSEVEMRFDQLASDDGRLPKSRFAQCIGTDQ